MNRALELLADMRAVRSVARDLAETWTDNIGRVSMPSAQRRQAIDLHCALCRLAEALGAASSMMLRCTRSPTVYGVSFTFRESLLWLQHDMRKAIFRALTAPIRYTGESDRDLRDRRWWSLDATVRSGIALGDG